MASAMFDELPYYRDYKLEQDEIDLRSYLLDKEHLADDIAAGRIPTPAVLAILQRTQGQPPVNPSAKDAPPFPPRRLKAEIFDLGKYAGKDRYVRALLPEQLESEDEFALRLFKESRSNLDKVRAAFYFVCTAAVEDMRDAAKDSGTCGLVRRLLREGKVDELFVKLLGVGGVPHKVIQGYKKGVGSQPGLQPQPNGSWTACFVEGEWRFVDAVWASLAVRGFDAGTFARIDGATGRVGSARKAEGSTVRLCNEFYFLTDPVELVQSHLPLEEMRPWQLLARPLSLAEFQRAPNFFPDCKQDASGFSLRLLSHPLSVIVAPPGTVEILLKETGDKAYQYRAEVAIYTKHLDEAARAAIKQQTDVMGYVSKPSRCGDRVVKFKFVPPCAAKFELRIMVGRTGQPDEMSAFADYVIHCPRANERAQQVPKGSEQLHEFGAGERLTDAGLTSDEPGELRTEDGERTLGLTALDGRQHTLDCLLMSAGNERLPAENVLSWSEGARFNAMFLAPDAGSFALVIQDEERPLCQFLIDAPSEFPGSGEFGLPDFKKLGGLGLVDSEMGQLIKPLSHASPVVVSEEPSVDLKFSATEPVDVRAELLAIDSDGREAPADGFAFVSSSSEGFEVSVRLQLPGHYVTRLHARRPSSGEWRHFGNYFVRSQGQQDGSASQFPETGEAWNSGNRLVEPTNRLLPLNKFVPIVLQISDPAVKCLLLVDEATGETTQMCRKGNIWQGTCRGFRKQAGSRITVMGGAERDSCRPLLSFQARTTAEAAEGKLRKG